jgi:hypothetical protein
MKVFISWSGELGKELGDKRRFQRLVEEWGTDVGKEG